MTVDKTPVLVPFAPWHLKLTQPQESLDPELTDELAHIYADKGLAFTGLDYQANVIGCGGIVPLWTGVGQAWLVPGPKIADHRLWLIRHLREFVDTAPFMRLQTACMSTRADHAVLIELLGFKHEGTMRHYGPQGADYELYARIRE